MRLTTVAAAVAPLALRVSAQTKVPGESSNNPPLPILKVRLALGTKLNQIVDPTVYDDLVHYARYVIGSSAQVSMSNPLFTSSCSPSRGQVVLIVPLGWA